MEENSLNQFKFIKRRLSVHYSISRDIAFEQQKFSGENSPTKSINRRRSIYESISLLVC